MSGLLDVIPSMPIAPQHEPPPGFGDAARACISAELACGAWVSAALRRSNLDRWRECIARTLDCLEICATTAKVLTRNLDSDPEVLRSLLEACARACGACGAECHRLAEGYPLCRTCADVCKGCEAACAQALRRLEERAA